MPPGSYFQGLLIVALDPLNRIEDVDRTDNIFVQFVRMENQLAATEYTPDCSMFPSTSVPGIYHLLFYQIKYHIMQLKSFRVSLFDIQSLL